MSARSVGALTLAACVAASSGAAVQGLGDVAAREKQKRRAQQQAPKPVLTNDDLPRPGERAGAATQPAKPGEAGTKPEGAAAGEPPSAVAGTGDAGARPDGPPALSDPVERERHERALLEAHWRERFAIARERLAVADARAWTEGYRIEIYNGVPIRVRTRERVETDELKRAREAMAELEEEFRRTGLPAGWARE